MLFKSPVPLRPVPTASMLRTANQATLMADILANLGSFVLEKKEDADPSNPRRSRH